MIRAAAAIGSSKASRAAILASILASNSLVMCSVSDISNTDRCQMARIFRLEMHP